jgi:hypothetical protein
MERHRAPFTGLFVCSNFQKARFDCSAAPSSRLYHHRRRDASTWSVHHQHERADDGDSDDDAGDHVVTE